MVIVGRPKASTLKLVSYCIHESTDALHFSSPCSVYCAAFWAAWEKCATNGHWRARRGEISSLNRADLAERRCSHRRC